MLPLFPILLIFFIGSVAETNRAPFDLAEAESELVSGFMTEHAAVIFVFFFLAEYSSILLMCILTTIFFMGGYLVSYDIVYLFDKLNFILPYLYDLDLISSYENFKVQELLKNPFMNGLFSGLIIGLKSSMLVFLFI
jgi:NADH-ubiquinone oxidoreductase chain 1